MNDQALTYLDNSAGWEIGSGPSFVIVDAAMNDLARPVLYDAPHAITRVHRSSSEKNNVVKRADIVGPVCETGDRFLEGWPLGSVQAGDAVAIWGVGAYGMVQSSNYNNANFGIINNTLGTGRQTQFALKWYF